MPKVGHKAAFYISCKLRNAQTVINDFPAFHIVYLFMKTETSHLSRAEVMRL